MPTIQTIGSIKIYIYFNDHQPPHFHVHHGELKALIEIETLSLISGTITPRTLNRVRDWASKNRRLLRRKWKEYNPAL